MIISLAIHGSKVAVVETAYVLAAQRRLPHISNCSITYKLIRNTKSQQGSSAKERRINLKGAFDIADIDVKGKTVLLVDDVRTTGATLNECAKVLKKNGAERVCAVVIAVTQ